MRPRGTAPALLLVALSLTACGDGSSSESGGRVLVAAGFHPLAQAAEVVGGDRVDVRDVTPTGAEPHDVELTARQVDLIEDAGLVILLGAGFQPAVEDAVRRRDGRTLVVVDALDVDTGGDPHVWLDPALMARSVRVVAEMLAAVDPDGAATYEARARDHEGRLAELDERFDRSLARCEHRTIVVPHAAFGWLAARYDLEQVALAGTDPHAEPDPRRLGRVARMIEERAISTVFRDRGGVDDAVRTVARETGATVAVLDSLEQAGSGADGGYVERMEANLAALTSALGCGGTG